MKLPNPVHVASDTLLASDQVLRNSHMSRSCEDSLPSCGFLFHNKRQFSGLVACFLLLPFLPLLLPFWALPLFLFCCLSLQHAAATCPRSQLLSLYKQSLRCFVLTLDLSTCVPPQFGGSRRNVWTTTPSNPDTPKEAPNPHTRSVWTVCSRNHFLVFSILCLPFTQTCFHFPISNM